MRITDYPDLLRTKGKEPMPQAWDETNQDWTPAIDSAATLKALREALGAPADATQADPVQEATAIALLKGLLELTAMRATDQTLTQIKTALTDGTQQVQLAVLNGAGQPTKAQLDAWNRFAATVYATDGAIDSLGARADVAQTDTTQAATAIALLKGLIELGKTVGTENTLQLIQTALGGLNEKDFATQATLAQVLTKLGDLSTATNQEAVKLVLDTISNAVAAKATEQTLTQIKTALTDGTQKVALTGKKVEFATLADAISVPAGGDTGYLLLYPTSEDLILVAVNIDQYPWTLGHSTMYYSAATRTSVNAMYPRRQNVNKTFTFTAAPAISMWLGNAVAGDVTSYSDAIAVHRVYKSAHGLDRITVINDSASTATVTVRIIRVWTK